MCNGLALLARAGRRLESAPGEQGHWAAASALAALVWPRRGARLWPARACSRRPIRRSRYKWLPAQLDTGGQPVCSQPRPLGSQLAAAGTARRGRNMGTVLVVFKLVGLRSEEATTNGPSVASFALALCASLSADKSARRLGPPTLATS